MFTETTYTHLNLLRLSKRPCTCMHDSFFTYSLLLWSRKDINNSIRHSLPLVITKLRRTIKMSPIGQNRFGDGELQTWRLKFKISSVLNAGEIEK